MTALEITFVLFLNVFTLFALAAVGWVAIIVPLREDIQALKERAAKVPINPVPLVGPRPATLLPSLDDLPESAFEIGEYGADDTTPEEVEDEMTDLQTAVREADAAWVELEGLKHGKRQPIIYSGR